LIYKKLKRLLTVPLLVLLVVFMTLFTCLSASAAATMTLTATSNPSGNYIALSWTNSDRTQPYSYMLFSKSSVESTFQSIPSKNSVSVLNIYPDVAPTISFVTWKGENCTLPQSAALKMWMETPNEYNAKGFGQGLISVDTVSITAFNNNPDSYLKNADGSYRYDVLYFGAWDSNNSQDLSTAAETSTDAFIRTGRGVCFGHDTMVSNNIIAMPNFYKLAHYADIQTISNYTVLGSAQINVAKKGLLTNYPWQIGDVGTILNVPMSHSNQLALGDIWMTYQQPYTYSGSTAVTGPNGQGTNTFYLTTWCNAAMIQTGHSNGAATPDEQRVTANTLFYLAQITTDTSWNDHKGQDLAAPTAPAVSGVDLTATQGTVHFTDQDNAMGYQYYVEATGQNDGAKYDSPIVNTSIESGMKGYSIVVDSNPSTVPNGSITTTAASYTFARPAGSGFYIHIAAVDNEGNVSSVTHYHVQNIISVTHPVSVNYAINPNSNGPFSAPDIPVTNNSDMPVSVTVEGLKSVSGGSLAFTDVDPASKPWNTLSLTDSKKYIALGVKAKDASGWSNGYNAGTFWSVNTSPMLIGSLNPSTTGTLTLTADSGLAFDNAYTAVHSLSFLFQLT